MPFIPDGSRRSLYPFSHAGLKHPPWVLFVSFHRTHFNTEFPFQRSIEYKHMAPRRVGPLFNLFLKHACLYHRHTHTRKDIKRWVGGGRKCASVSGFERKWECTTSSPYRGVLTAPMVPLPPCVPRDYFTQPSDIDFKTTNGINHWVTTINNGRKGGHPLMSHHIHMQHGGPTGQVQLEMASRRGGGR